MAKEKVNLYLLAIVAIVAVVGIVVLVMNAGTTTLSVSADDLTGQVARVSSARMQTASCNGPGEATCGGSCCNYYTHDCINLHCTPK
jgi:hypothetical protein